MKKEIEKRSFEMVLTGLLFAAVLLAQSYRVAAQATPQIDFPGPTGSVAFGTQVTALPNGNIVVTDPLYNGDASSGYGAVYLYSPTGQLISQMIGERASDGIGSGGVTILSSGDFVVASPGWARFFPPPVNQTFTFAGAVTRCSGTTGCPSVITLANSLTGDKANDLVGGNGNSTRQPAVISLNNGNYVVRSYYWSASAAVQHVGAVTFCDGASNSCANKIVSGSNSLIGSRANDFVGGNINDEGNSITVLTNGDYVVGSPQWYKTAASIATGAVTKCSGTTGCVGTVSTSNSLTGSNDGDALGGNNLNGSGGGVFALPNNMYVIGDPSWNSAAANAFGGAVILCNGTTNNCTGQTITPANSLIGSTSNDHIGANLTIFPNGDYLSISSDWDKPAPNAVVDAGAVTLCRMASNSCAGQTVATSNSLTGALVSSQIGYGKAVILPNGNYVVSSPTWKAADFNGRYGAATYCNGTTNNCAGQTPSAGNSLVGDFGDAVSGNLDGNRAGITVLTNGNYVVSSPQWIDRTTNPITQYVGAVTLCNGSTGCTGSPNRANSLTGSAQTDYVGYDGVTPLANGNYVVNSSAWFSPQVPITLGYGATTLCSGASNNCAGQTVTAANSLTGTKQGDLVGVSGSVALPNGNYVVTSGLWDASPSTADVGAVTFCNAASNSCGGQQVSVANSLTGSAANDKVGMAVSQFLSTVRVLPNGNYSFTSPLWNNGATADTGAFSIGNSSTGISGSITGSNSVRGQTASGGDGINYVVGSSSRIYVGRPKDNKITIVGGGSRTPFDFDGDSKTDLSIFRPGPGEWWWLKSATGGNAALQFGAATDKLTPADFTGDGKTDVAFWRPSTGFWYVLRSEDFSFYSFPFGSSGDVTVPADYDGDGKADAAVFRPSSVTWFISKSSGGTQITTFGAAGDQPVNADYDGDGKSDIAIFRPTGANGAEWWVQRSSNASVFALQFGTSTDKAVPGDFTGDGKADVAFWRPSTGAWNVLRSEDFSYYAFPFGANGDVASPGDYDGDGKIDAAVFRPSSSTWFANKSGGGTLIQQFGITGDVPLPNAFVR